MYLDGTESPPAPSVPPTWCPQCRGKLVTKWAPMIKLRRGVGFYPVAAPWHVCEPCGISVRVCKQISKTLHTTRAAAKTAGAKELKQRLKPWKA